MNLFNKATGMLVIEVIMSNPNGDPDRESDPRLLPDGRVAISDVSLKRKVRDLIDTKEGAVWRRVAGMFEPKLDPDRHHILETRGRDRSQIEQELKDGHFTSKYWDARVFGCTFLEEAKGEYRDQPIRTGVIQIGTGISISRGEVSRWTNTNKAGVQAGKDRGMAPMGFRVVEHAVFTMPFFINPTAAVHSGADPQDVEVFSKVLPFAYSHTASRLRSQVHIRHAWYAEHKSPVGSVSETKLLAALVPVRKGEDALAASKSWDDYDVPEKLPEELLDKLESFRDLTE